MFKTVTKFIIYGNIWVSFSVLFFTYSTFLFLDSSINYSYLSFSFFSTLLAYNFQRVYKISKLKESTLKNQWLIAHKTQLYLLVLIGFIGTIVSFSFLPNQVWVLLILPIFLSVFYVVPINKKKQAFRDLPFIKIYLIAITWVFISVVIPIYLNEVSWHVSIGLLIEKLSFVIALTIPFDVRDMKFDNPIKKTIPQLLGVKKALFLAIFFLILSGVTVFWLFQQGFYSFSMLVSIFLSYLISGVVVLMTNTKRQEVFYTGIIDGLFILQFVLIYIGWSLID